MVVGVLVVIVSSPFRVVSASVCLLLNMQRLSLSPSLRSVTRGKISLPRCWLRRVKSGDALLTVSLACCTTIHGPRIHGGWETEFVCVFPPDTRAIV